jgi:putative PIN family toxin of toxin-antitoxin system
MPIERVVVDTSVLVSGILFPQSLPAQALHKAQQLAVLASEATKLELIRVLERRRFDRYVELTVRRALAAEYVGACVHVDIPSAIRACRDPRDDKFLEVAVHGRADILITGDADLLALHPFQGIAILSPASFLAL